MEDTSIPLYGFETWTLLADSEKKDSGFRNQMLLGAQDQRLGAEQDQLPCGSTETSPGNRQETEICMIRVGHTPQQPHQNHPSRHCGGWATPWSAEEMLDGQHQYYYISARARTAQKVLKQKRLKEDVLCIVPMLPPRPNRSRD